VNTVTTLALALAAAAFASLARAEPPARSAAPAVDYTKDEAWLCRPGRQDACSRADEDATIVRADGTLAADPFVPAKDPPIDCFYVYPTVSRDPGANATMAIEPEEVQVVEQQFARFAAKCRLYAPVYRQVTLTALQAAMLGRPMAADRAMAYGDVLAAWNDYLARDNHGRGVVLIGHSQGSGVLIELVKREIDGRPVAGKVLSVILGGARLQVPVGKDVGGDFKSTPLCRTSRQLGCAINFASFRAESPPPADSRFGGSSGPGLEAACVNPAALGGGEGSLHAYLASGTQKIVAADAQTTRPWTDPPQPIATPFVEAPGLLTARCASDAAHTWLAITVHPDPSGRRVGEISGDVVVGGRILKDWGLHLIDMNLAMGDLVRIVGDEAEAFAAKTR
jgi:hypothetical protein